jgi:tetratricopeptide (TPR) repeat protein
MTLKMAYDARLMYEAALPVLFRMEGRLPKSPLEPLDKLDVKSTLAEYEQKLGPAPPTSWRNLSELDQIVTALLGAGRAESAASLLEQAYPTEEAPWDVVDRIAALRLHLGEPARARALWRRAASVPEPAVRDARIGTTYLVEGDFEAARREYRTALDAKPDLFEANYCLAVLSQDDGDAKSAYEMARKAIGAASDEAARSAARLIALSVSRFARPAGSKPAQERRELPATRSLGSSP